MSPSRKHFILAVFFLLWAGNCILSHATGKEFIDLARQWHREQQAAEAVETTVEDSSTQPPDIDQDTQARGAILVLTNLPLFVGLGFLVRDAVPETGFLYWTLVIVGSVYVPIILTVSVFFLLHAPQSAGGFPGTVQSIDELEDEEDDDK